MKKLLTLTKNELTKQLKTRWFALLLIVFFLLCFFMPIANHYLAAMQNDSDYYAENGIEEAKEQLSAATAKGSNEKTALRTMQETYWREQVALYTAVQGEPYDSWRFEVLESAQSAFGEYIAYEAVDSGCTAEEITDKIDGRYIYSGLLDNYVTASASQKKQLKNDAKKEYESLKKIFESKDDKQYTRYSIAKLQAELSDLEKSERSLSDAAQKNPTDSTARTQLKSVQEDIAYKKSLLQVEEYRLSNNVTYENSDWRHLTLVAKKQALDSLYEPVLTEREFQNDEYSKYNFNNYEAYLSGVQKGKDKSQETIAVADASLGDQTPHSDFLDDSYARVPAHNALNTTTVIVFILIMISGSAISAEHTRGTVRLLLIRPASRTKIFLSKLFMLLITGFALYFIALVLSVLAHGILLGFGDYLNPVYEAVRTGGVVTVVKHNFFLWMLPQFFVCFTSIVFFCTAGLFMSTLTKNTALSVAFTSLGKVFSPLVVYLLLNLKQNWVVYTFIPYVEMSDFFSKYSVVTSYLNEFNIEVNIPLACGLLLGYSLLLTLISLYVFNKRDVS